MAEEAVGLAKSLSWSIIQGFNTPPTEESQKPMEPEEYEGLEAHEAAGRPMRGRRTGRTTYSEDGVKLKDWDPVYISGTDISGYYYKGGLAMVPESDSDSELEDEWTDLDMRHALAQSSVVRVRRPSATHFFTKGKLEQLSSFIQSQEPEVVFINHALTPLQYKTLQQ